MVLFCAFCQVFPQHRKNLQEFFRAILSTYAEAGTYLAPAIVQEGGPSGVVPANYLKGGSLVSALKYVYILTEIKCKQQLEYSAH